MLTREPGWATSRGDDPPSLSVKLVPLWITSVVVLMKSFCLAATSAAICSLGGPTEGRGIERVSLGGGVTCRPHNPLPWLSSLSPLPDGYRELLVPALDQLLFQPNFALIFFQPLPSPRAVRLEPGEEVLKLT